MFLCCCSEDLIPEVSKRHYMRIPEFCAKNYYVSYVWVSAWTPKACKAAAQSLEIAPRRSCSLRAQVLFAWVFGPSGIQPRIKEYKSIDGLPALDLWLGKQQTGPGTTLCPGGSPTSHICFYVYITGVYICIYIYMCSTCVYECMHTYIYEYLYMYIFVCLFIYTCMHAHMKACGSLYMCTYIYVRSACIYIYRQACVNVWCAHTHVCIHIICYAYILQTSTVSPRPQLGRSCATVDGPRSKPAIYKLADKVVEVFDCVEDGCAPP